MSIDTQCDTAAPDTGARTTAADEGVLRTVLRNRVAVAALAVLVVLVLVSVVAALAPWRDPLAQALRERLQGPSPRHPLGSDELGRDQLVRLAGAAGVSLGAALVATVVGLVCGLPLGLLAGFTGGRLDGVVSRAFDALQSIPPLIFAIAVVAVLGRDLIPAMVAIGVVFSPTFFRVTRAATMSVARETYIEASRSMGGRTPRILAGHVLGNVGSAVIVQISTTLAFGILAEAALSFLGLGVQPPRASLGSMLTQAANLLNTAPQLAVEPGLVIVVLVLAITLVSDAFRDATAGEGRW
ncbi:MAG TPA: ABC transporter permease [Pseudonocardia sp.]|jgi:peptide/nickel transport system permease protein|nr:ABC transporter permease [Pseudonocardia sp.]